MKTETISSSHLSLPLRQPIFSLSNPPIKTETKTLPSSPLSLSTRPPNFSPNPPVKTETLPLDRICKTFEDLETQNSPITLPLDRILKTFEDLETQKSLISNCFLHWQNLYDHYSSLEKTVADRSQSLDSKLESLDSEAKQALESLEQRESSLPHRESSATTLIEDRRASVVAEIENPESRTPRNLNGILRWYCRRMDSPGLWRFMVARRKELEVLRREILEAVSESVDPPRLILDALEDFMNNPAAAAAAAVACGGERCWSVSVLVKALFDLVGKKAVEVSGSIRDRAAVVAESWRTMYMGKKVGEEVDEEGKDDVDKGGMEGVEGRIFLRIVISFGLRSRFDDDFLLKLVVENASRKEMTKHATRLGFGDKIEDVIELVKNGKEIDAIYFAHESGILDKFSPVPLLKSHLQNSRKNANVMLKRNQSAAFAEESNKLELKALKSIIKCVETLNLEQMFTLDSLKTRVIELESGLSSDRKKKRESSKESRRKRSRPGLSNFRSSKLGRPSKPYPPPYRRNKQPRMTAVQIPPLRQSFHYTALPPSYAAAAAAAHRGTSVPHYFPPDDISGARGPTLYGGPSINYGGSYDYIAPPPAHPQYQQ